MGGATPRPARGAPRGEGGDVGWGWGEGGRARRAAKRSGAAPAAPAAPPNAPGVFFRCVQHGRDAVRATSGGG